MFRSLFRSTVDMVPFKFQFCCSDRNVKLQIITIIMLSGKILGDMTAFHTNESRTCWQLLEAIDC